jgi:hypothetical protein
MPGIDRASFSTAVAFAGGATQSSPIDVRGYAGAIAYFPSTYTGGTATWRACPTFGGSYLPTYGYDKSQQGSLTGVAGKAIELPPAVMSSGFARLHRAAASPTAATVRVTLKG